LVQKKLPEKAFSVGNVVQKCVTASRGKPQKEGVWRVIADKSREGGP